MTADEQVLMSSGAPGSPLLRITDLHTTIRGRHREVHAVRGVSLELAQGEALGLVGESGSGKSMTAMSILRLLPRGGSITGGSIELAGRDLVSLQEKAIRQVRGNDVGVVFQDPLSSLNPTMSIGDQIAEAVLEHRQVSHKEALDRAVEVLGLVGLPQPRERIREYAHQFSGGMRQRVMIAIALACEPKLLIADEPTTALDVTIQKQILNLIDSLRQRLGMAVLLVTHDLGVIAGHTDRVSVMYAGKIAEAAETENLFARARHPYTVALFDALPERAAQSSDRLRTISGMPPDLARPITGCSFAPRCPRAQDPCKEETPELTGADHSFACFFPVEVQLSDEPAPEGPVSEKAGDPADNAASIVTPGLVAAAAEDSRPDVAEPDQPLLELVAASKEYPVVRGMFRREVGRISAVAEVSLSAQPGTTLGLVGESGCGKTTIGRLVVGLETLTAGTIRFHGSDIATLKGDGHRRYRRGVQYMFQDSAAAMDPRMRVGPILREPLLLQREGTARERDQRVLSLLDEVGMPKSAVDRYPHEFSGGQRQRIGLARALALTPELIIADEPVSALDVSIQAQVLNLMRDLQQRHGLALIVISHDLSVIRYLADSIAVMYLGKVVEEGPAEAVYERPLHPYTRGLIDTVPVPDPKVERARRGAGVSGELASAMKPPSGCRFRTRCPRVTEICAEVEPVLESPAPEAISRPARPSGHRVACHHPLESGSL